jgi:hypothetical protein
MGKIVRWESVRLYWGWCDFGGCGGLTCDFAEVFCGKDFEFFKGRRGLDGLNGLHSHPLR